MGKLESYGAGLLPVAIIAGILSGSFFREAPVPQTPNQPPKPPTATRAVEDVRTAWLADVRPVMEAIGDAMGLPVHRESAVRLASLTLEPFKNPQPAEVTKAIATVRERLNRQAAGPDPPACEPDSPTSSVAIAEQTLIGYLLAPDTESSSSKLRSSLVQATLNELQDWRALATLARNVPADEQHAQPRYRATFIVATVPDYVDSVAGWTADQSLAAIQSAMSRSGYLLDRFRLVDWTRIDPHSENPVATESRLHERQPGALIFRRQEKGDRIELAVVLLALETPTSGVHRTALRNAIRFIREWNRCTAAFGPDPEQRDLRILGPTFSGSSLSVALTLRDLGDQDLAAFTKIQVTSGSATADENTGVFRDIAPRNTSFQATVPPTSETQQIMAAYLGRMNRDWLGGARVAILRESNTAYGQTSNNRSADAGGDDPFKDASVFSFPMHLSQLRSDTPDSAASVPSLLPTSGVPLNMRETTPPADLIPALRPQLTSPVVESTVDTIIDTIRHKRLTAVGIQATDDRDVLFLAREVKRAAPDVQLFFLGAHALYLHQDYVPYLRGTLVASPYPLSLTNQAGFSDVRAPGREAPGREPFQSMAAQGLFNATLLLLHRDAELLDYCDPRAPSGTPCRPRVTVSVIGEDGFWPLAGVDMTKPVLEHASEKADGGHESTGSGLLTYVVRVKGTFEPQGLPPLPTRVRIILTMLSGFVIAQVLMVLAIGRQLRRGVPARCFLEWPVLRILVPPVTYPPAAALHRFSLLMSFVLLALLSAWTAAIAVPFISPAVGNVPAVVTAVLAAAMVLVPSVLLISVGAHARPRRWPALAKRKSSWMLMPALVLLVLTIATFVWYLTGLLRPAVPDDLNLTLARLVGGGIVSPSPATLCLFAGLYTGIFAAMRRLSLVGNGYTALEDRSTAFNLLNGVTDAGEAHHTPTHRARLGDMLDMPSQNLPLSYVIGILLGIVIACLAVGKVSTVDGRAFKWFFSFASVTVLMLGLTNLAQGLAIWNNARTHLRWLALSPMEGAFTSIAPLVPWDLSVGPPRVMELMPVAQRADGIIGKLRVMAGRTERQSDSQGCDGSPDGLLTDIERRLVEMKLGIRRGDLDAEGKGADVTSNVRLLEREMGQQQHAALIQSSTWMHFWRVSDAIVEMLAEGAWRRIAPETHRPVAPPSTATVAVKVRLPENGPVEAGSATPVRVAAVVDAPAGSSPESNESPGFERAALFQQCEEFVALQFAFVLRDIVARTVAALFTAMLCLTLLTAGHLLYTFNPRSSLLTVDLLAVAGASLTSIWILVSMEREPVLSRLRNSTPGRVDLNWTFVQRVAVYGVLPLVVVLASLFPEIGGSVFGWLEPLRKLINY